jgi:hypothetical protein
MASPFLSICLKEMKSAYRRETRTAMFIVTVLTVVRYGISLGTYLQIIKELRYILQTYMWLIKTSNRTWFTLKMSLVFTLIHELIRRKSFMES